MDILTATLGRLRWRWAVQRWTGFLTAGLLVSSVACCIWLVIDRMFLSSGHDLLLFAILIVAGVVGASGWAWYCKPTLLQTALEADRRLDLHERLTSSLELASVQGPMIEALHQDARQCLARVNPVQAFPFGVPRTARWLAAFVVALGVAYLFLPPMDLFGLRAREVQAKAREEARRLTAESLKAAVRPLKEPSELPEASDVLASAENIERVAEQLMAGALTDKQALAKLSGLAETLAERREALQPASAVPKLSESLGQLASTQSAAANIANGNFGAAAQKIRELQKKLQDGSLKSEEKEKIAEDLQKLASLLKNQEPSQNGQPAALGAAMAQAAAGLKGASMSPDALADADASGANMALEDVASILEQLDKLNAAMTELMKWQQAQLGPSSHCRICGAALKPCQNPGHCKGCGPGHCCYGLCGTCAGSGWCPCAGKGPWRMGFSNKFSNGMGGPGHGRGNSTGPLPDVADSFTPSMLPGEITKGKFLASIVQRTAPEQGSEPTAQFVTGVVAEAKQEAEQALTKEEIPPAAREFVRQYFSTLEPAP